MHQSMVQIGLVQILSLTLLFLVGLVPIGLQKSIDQASRLSSTEVILFVKQVKVKMPDLILGRGKTKTFGKGCWGEDNCMVGQTKVF